MRAFLVSGIFWHSLAAWWKRLFTSGWIQDVYIQDL